jgi:hypothetical protein
MTLDDLRHAIEDRIMIRRCDVGIGSYEWFGACGTHTQVGLDLLTEMVAVEIESDPLDALPLSLDLRYGSGPDAVPVTASLFCFGGTIATYTIALGD